MRRTFGPVVAGIAAVLGTALLMAEPARAQASQQDQSWLIAMHQSHLAIVESATLAQQRATSAEVRNLGVTFVQMHRDLDAQLTALALQLDVDLPTRPSTEQQQQFSALSAQSGAAFDSAWVAQQRTLHQQALQTTQLELTSGTEPRVVAQAQATATILQQHLAQLQQLAGTPQQIPTGDGGLLAVGGAGGPDLARVAIGAALVALGAAWWVRRSRPPGARAAGPVQD
jgi:putative membrane protein